jgi:hypothetical protein
MASVSSAQPNVPGRGIVASYSPRFWMLVVLIGGAGVLAASMQAPGSSVDAHEVSYGDRMDPSMTTSRPTDTASRVQ